MTAGKRSRETERVGRKEMGEWDLLVTFERGFLGAEEHAERVEKTVEEVRF